MPRQPQRVAGALGVAKAGLEQCNGLFLVCRTFAPIDEPIVSVTASQRRRDTFAVIVRGCRKGLRMKPRRPVGGLFLRFEPFIRGSPVLRDVRQDDPQCGMPRHHRRHNKLEVVFVVDMEKRLVFDLGYWALGIVDVVNLVRPFNQGQCGFSRHRRAAST